MKHVLILGGTSDIGRAIALTFAKRGYAVQLAGRDLAMLEREATDISLKTGATISVHSFDVLATGDFAGMLDSLPALPDVAISVIGLLGEQSLAEADDGHATLVMRSNFEGPALFLDHIALRFSARGSGTIIGISSVAGDRGRKSNYIYGAAKAGFTAFLSGLRNRLFKQGVHVITVKPGFVRTKMTEGMKLPGALTADASEVGEAVWNGHEKKNNVVYVRSIWWLIMTIIRSIPEFIFKRLSL